MPISFPSSPSNGDTYTYGSTLYTYDGEKWVGRKDEDLLDGVIATPSITSPSNNATGVSHTADLTITSSAYVDSSLNSGSHAASQWEVYSGSYPLQSTNKITSVDINNTDWTFQSFEATTADYYRVARANSDGSVIVHASLTGASASNPSNYPAVCRARGINDSNWTSVSLSIPGGSGGTMAPGDVRYSGGYFILWGGGSKSDGGTANGFGVNPDPLNQAWNTRQVNVDTLNGGQSIGVYAGYLYFNGGNTDRYMRCPVPALAQPSGISLTNSWGNPRPFDMATDDVNNIAIMLTELDGKYFRNTSNGPDVANWIPVDHTGGGLLGISWNGVRFVQQLNKFFIIADSGMLCWSDDGGLTWSQVQTGLGADILYLNYDGTHLIVSSDNWVTYTTDLTTFATWAAPMQVNGTSVCPVQACFNNGSLYVSAELSTLDDPANWGVYQATVFLGTTSLVVSGVGSDGFAVGQVVQNLGGLSASGKVTEVNANNIVIAEPTGSWSAGTYVQTSSLSYNAVGYAPFDGNNLLNYTVPAGYLSPSTDYYARVRYKSSLNVESANSAWTKFTTSA